MLVSHTKSSSKVMICSIPMSTFTVDPRLCATSCPSYLIWSVAVDDALYVRAYSGQSSRWYQSALRQKAGRIIAAKMTMDVTFEPVDGPMNDRIDDAYRAKYRGSPYLSPMISTRARSATV